MLAIVSFEVVDLRFTLRLPACAFSLAALAGAGVKSKSPRHCHKPGQFPAYYKKKGLAPEGAVEKLFGGGLCGFGSHLADGIKPCADFGKAGFFALLDIRLQSRAQG